MLLSLSRLHLSFTKDGDILLNPYLARVVLCLPGNHMIHEQCLLWYGMSDSAERDIIVAESRETYIIYALWNLRSIQPNRCSRMVTARYSSRRYATLKIYIRGVRLSFPLRYFDVRDLTIFLFPSTDVKLGFSDHTRSTVDR
jgi:hypothetical protein